MAREAEASSHIDATGAEVFSVLTDYGRYSEWMPGISRSRVLAREGDIVVAEFGASELVGGDVVLEFVESPPRVLVFSQVDRLRQTGLSGRVDLVDPASGEGVVATVRARLKSSLWNLSAAGRLRSALTDSMVALHRRAAASASGGDEAVRGERRKVLEVVRRNGGLEVWFQGELYRGSEGPSP